MSTSHGVGNPKTTKAEIVATGEKILSIRFDF